MGGKGGRETKRHTERWRDREKEKKGTQVFAFLRGPYVCVPFVCLLQILGKVDCNVGRLTQAHIFRGLRP